MGSSEECFAKFFLPLAFLLTYNCRLLQLTSTDIFMHLALELLKMFGCNEIKALVLWDTVPMLKQLWLFRWEMLGFSVANQLRFIVMKDYLTSYSLPWDFFLFRNAPKTLALYFPKLKLSVQLSAWWMLLAKILSHVPGRKVAQDWGKKQLHLCTWVVITFHLSTWVIITFSFWLILQSKWYVYRSNLYATSCYCLPILIFSWHNLVLPLQSAGTRYWVLKLWRCDCVNNCLTGLCVYVLQCSWGSKPTPAGTSSTPLPPPAAPHMPGISAADFAAYERQMALSKMGGAQGLMHPQAQHALKQTAMGMGAGGSSQAIYDGGFQNAATTQQLMYYQ